VLYPLDGDLHFSHSTGTVSWLSGFADKIPELFIVTIKNTDRVKILIAIAIYPLRITVADLTNSSNSLKLKLLPLLTTPIEPVIFGYCQGILVRLFLHSIRCCTVQVFFTVIFR